MAPQPLALRRAQHTLTDLYGYRGFGTLPEIDGPHCVALVDGRPAVLVWWAEGLVERRRIVLATAALLGDRDDVGFIWAVRTGAAGDGLAMRVGPEGIVAIDRLPDAEAFRAPPIHAPLDSVDWRRLTDAYGPATATRDHLRTLLSAADPAERADAVYRLYLGICHQTVSLAEATAPSIPFLIAAGERPDAVGVLRLLTDIAELAGLPLDDAPPDEAAWSRRCAMMLGAGAERIATWVRVAEGNPRRAAALRLALAVRRTAPGAAGPLDAVVELARADRDPTMRMLAVRALAADGERARLRPALDDPALRVRTFAALPLLTDPDLAERAWAVVDEVLGDLDGVDRWFDPPHFPDEMDGPEAHAPVEILEAVVAAGRPRADAVLDRLIDLLARARSSARLGPIIRLFWPDRRVPDDAGHDPIQVAALAALARNRRFWRGGDRQVLPAPFDAETEWEELRDRVLAMPARAELPPERAAVEFGPRPAAELAGEIVRDVVTDADGDLSQMGDAIRRLRLGPELTDDVLGILCAACPRLETLALTRPRITTLAPLTGLGHLRELTISGLALDGPDPLAPLAAARQLRRVALIEPRIDGHALAPLAGLPRLSRLRLAHAPGAGLHPLEPTPKLAELCLAGPLTPAAWRALPRIKAVRLLRLSEMTLPPDALSDWGGSRLTRMIFETCVVRPGALADAAPLSALRRLTLIGCAVHDAEFAGLARMPALTHLELIRTPLGAGAADVLAGLGPGLRLSLVETGLSPAVVRDLCRRRRGG